MQHAHWENLWYFITYFYGEETFRRVRLFEKLRKRKAKQLSGLAFLLRCRDCYTVPKFADYDTRSRLPAQERYYGGLALHSSKSAYINNTRSSSLTSSGATGKIPSVWEIVEHTTMAQSEMLLRKVTTKQMNKFNGEKEEGRFVFNKSSSHSDKHLRHRTWCTHSSCYVQGSQLCPHDQQSSSKRNTLWYRKGDPGRASGISWGDPPRNEFLFSTPKHKRRTWMKKNVLH